MNNDFTEALSKIKVPDTTINSDMEEPANVEEFQKHVPSFKAKIIPGAAHLVFFDNPEELNRLLEVTIQEFTKN